jgi:hypothetical protein
MNNKQSEKEIKKTTPFTISKLKYLGINLMMEVKTYTIKGINHQRKKSKKTLEDGKISHAYGLAESIL